MAYLFFYNFFDGADELRGRLVNQIKISERQKLRAMIAKQEIDAYQQQIALLIPANSQMENNYPLRNLASVVTEHDPDILKIEKAASLFDRGRKMFKSKHFVDSNEVFKRIVDEFSDSIHVVESYFLLVEGLYQIRQYEACADYANRLVTLFPESELAGFALLRMGAVYQERERLADAAEIYRLIVSTYKTDVLLQQARALLAEIDP